MLARPWSPNMSPFKAAASLAQASKPRLSRFHGFWLGRRFESNPRLCDALLDLASNVTVESAIPNGAQHRRDLLEMQSLIVRLKSESRDQVCRDGDDFFLRRTREGHAHHWLSQRNRFEIEAIDHV
jgi:hypothetical protein